jgi:hypothetical protein
MMATERRTVRDEKKAFREHQDYDVKDKLRRFREGLIRARYSEHDITRLERAYEKKLRGTND